MPDLLASVPVDQETKALLLTGAGRCGHCTSSCWRANPENGKTPTSSRSQLQLSESEIAEAYWHAMEWARAVSAE